MWVWKCHEFAEGGKGTSPSCTMGAGGIGAPFARLLANLIVMGSGMIGPMGVEFMKAYKAALQSACRPCLNTLAMLLKLLA